MSNLGQPALLFSFFPWLNLALNSNTEVCHDVTSLQFQSSDTDKSPPPWDSCSNTDIRCVHTHTPLFLCRHPNYRTVKVQQVSSPVFNQNAKSQRQKGEHDGGGWGRPEATEEDTVKVCDWSSSRTIVAGPSTVHTVLYLPSYSPFPLWCFSAWWWEVHDLLPQAQVSLVRPWRRPWTRAVREPWEDGSISQDSSSPVVLPMRIFSAMLMESPGRIQMGWETWNLLYCIRSCIHIPFCILLLLYSNCILWLKLPYITLSHFGACGAKETLLKTTDVA